MWGSAASGSNGLVNINTPICLRHFTSTQLKPQLRVITEASAMLFRPSVFALASPTCRPSRSGGNNISIFRQPMLSSHFYTRFQPADLLLAAHQAFLGTCGQHARGWPMPRVIP
jgi:hypothetical protein